MVDIDLTKFRRAAGRSIKYIDNCVVDDAGSGAFPRQIVVTIPGDDGAQLIAINNTLPTLAASDEVLISIDGNNQVARVEGYGSGSAGGGIDEFEVSKLVASDGAPDPALSADTAGDLTAVGDLTLGSAAKGRIEAVAHDFALHDSANALGVTSHFLDNDSSFPAGWTEADAAGLVNTSSLYSYWLLLGSSGETSWDYRIQTSIDLENDIAPNATVTVVVGPILWRDTTFTANVNYRIGLYRDSTGIDTATYARILLFYDSSAGAWKIQGEESDGSTPHTGSVITLGSAPLNQPLYLAITLNNAASKSIQCYWGKINDFALQQLLFSQAPTVAPTWGQFWVRFHMSRGAGSADRILIGSVDAQGL